MTPWTRRVALLALAAAASLGSVDLAWADPFTFTAGDLVISTVSCSVSTTTCDSTVGATAGGLDTASPITLQEFSLGAGGTSATSVGTLTLPQTQNGANAPISGEYGSASEGILEQSANGQYLTIMGYGISASQFNNNPSTYGMALGQTTSVAGQANTVPRVVALIGGDGSVNTTTALTGVFNENNPRSVATVNGTSFYVSGQGQTGDGTGGVFYAALGATTATPINANTTTPSGSDNGTENPLLATETRVVEIVNTGFGDTLYVSRDFAPKGSPNDSTDIRTLTNASGGLPTSASGLVANRIIPSTPSVTGGNTGSIDLTSALANGVNNARIGSFVYLSPEQYFFASPSVLYVADSGEPKNGNVNKAALGEGGLQKWVNSEPDGSGTWTLEYDLVAGLNLVNNANANSNTPTAPGVTGLFGLTGEDVMVNGVEEVELFATSYGLNELSQSYLYEITDPLDATSPGANEEFTTLYSAPPGTDIRGVAFAPVPEPSSLAILAAGLIGLGLVRRRRAGTLG